MDVDRGRVLGLELLGRAGDRGGGIAGRDEELAGAFVNLEPLVGALVGWVAFSDPVGPWQIIGAVSVIAGILISLLLQDFEFSLQGLGRRSRGRAAVLATDTLID